MLHEAEWPADHAVLKVVRAIHGRDFAREIPANAEVARAPRDALAEIEQTGRDAARGDGRLAPVDVSGEMHLDAAREIEAALNRGANDGKFLKRHHTIGYVTPPAGKTTTSALPGNLRRPSVHIPSIVHAKRAVGTAAANSFGTVGA